MLGKTPAIIFSNLSHTAMCLVLSNIARPCRTMVEHSFTLSDVRTNVAMYYLKIDFGPSKGLATMTAEAY
jgi:hypothetical protein